nr:hypothetical protein [Arthrobacter globiformis]
MLQRDEVKPGQFARFRFKVPAEGKVDDDERNGSALPEGAKVSGTEPGAAAAAADHHIRSADGSGQILGGQAGGAPG